MNWFMDAICFYLETQDVVWFSCNDFSFKALNEVSGSSCGKGKSTLNLKQSLPSINLNSSLEE